MGTAAERSAAPALSSLGWWRERGGSLRPSIRPSMLSFRVGAAAFQQINSNKRFRKKYKQTNKMSKEKGLVFLLERTRLSVEENIQPGLFR